MISFLKKGRASDLGWLMDPGSQQTHSPSHHLKILPGTPSIPEVETTEMFSALFLPHFPLLWCCDSSSSGVDLSLHGQIGEMCRLNPHNSLDITGISLFQAVDYSVRFGLGVHALSSSLHQCDSGWNDSGTTSMNKSFPVSFLKISSRVGGISCLDRHEVTEAYLSLPNCQSTVVARTICHHMKEWEKICRYWSSSEPIGSTALKVLLVRFLQR